MVMQAFNNFSNSTRLRVNPSKCMAYFGNIDQQTKTKIQDIIEFKDEPLPFRYLGIPLTSRKLLVGHCLLLVEKFVSRIKHWSSRLLSLAGRKHAIDK